LGGKRKSLLISLFQRERGLRTTLTPLSLTHSPAGAKRHYWILMFIEKTGISEKLTKKEIEF
jgi:hypothetical protein